MLQTKIRLFQNTVMMMLHKRKSGFVWINFKELNKHSVWEYMLKFLYQIALFCLPFTLLYLKACSLILRHFILKPKCDAQRILNPGSLLFIEQYIEVVPNWTYYLWIIKWHEEVKHRFSFDSFGHLLVGHEYKNFND